LLPRAPWSDRCSRRLTGLTEAEYFQRDEGTGRYRLGLGIIGLAGPLLAGRTVVRDGYRGIEDPTQQQLADVRDQGFAVNDGQECGVSAPKAVASLADESGPDALADARPDPSRWSGDKQIRQSSGAAPGRALL
jgi:hypothetical protein